MFLKQPLKSNFGPKNLPFKPKNLKYIFKQEKNYHKFEKVKNNYDFLQISPFWQKLETQQNLNPNSRVIPKHL